MAPVECVVPNEDRGARISIFNEYIAKTHSALMQVQKTTKLATSDAETTTSHGTLSRGRWQATNAADVVKAERKHETGPRHSNVAYCSPAAVSVSGCWLCIASVDIMTTTPGYQS